MLNNFEETYLSEYAANRRNDLEKLRPKDEECDIKKYYMKFRTLDTSYHFGMNNFGNLYNVLEKDFKKDAEAKKDLLIYHEFFETYIVEPFQNKFSLVIIMADRGSRLPEREPHFETTRKRLNELKIMADLLAEKMCHGDLLSHNFVLDSTGTPHIIDLDEGGIDEVPRRETTANIEGATENNKWFLALRYPNALREGHRVLYTKVQFAAAVLSLVPIDVLNSELLDLVKQAKTLGEALYSVDAEIVYNQFIEEVPDDISILISSIDKEVKKFLRVPVVAE